MSRKNTALGFFLYIVWIGIVLLLSEALNYLGLNTRGNIDVPSLIVLSVTAVVLMGLVVFLWEPIKVDRRTVIATILIIIIGFCGVFGVWASPSTIETTRVTYENQATLYDKIEWTIEWMVCLVTTLVSFFVLPKKAKGKRWLLFPAWICIIVTFAAISYSLATETDLYRAMIDGRGISGGHIRSFLVHENTFAQLLLLAIAACFLLNSLRFRWWHFLMAGFFYLWMILTTSFITLGFAFILFAAYCFYIFFKTYRKHPKTNLIVLFSVFGGLAALFGLYFLLDGLGVEWVNGLHSFIESDLDGKNFETMNGRIGLYDHAFTVIGDGIFLVFGRGYGNFNSLLNAYHLATSKNGMPYCDGTYVQMIGAFGIVGFLVYAVTLIYVGYRGIRSYMRNKSKTIGYALITYAVLLVYTAFETLILFSASLPGMATFALVALPLITEEKEKEEEPKYIDGRHLLPTLVSGLCFILAVFFLLMFVSDSGHRIGYLWGMFCSVFMAFVLPGIVSGLLAGRDTKRTLLAHFFIWAGIVLPSLLGVFEVLDIGSCLLISCFVAGLTRFLMPTSEMIGVEWKAMKEFLVAMLIIVPVGLVFAFLSSLVWELDFLAYFPVCLTFSSLLPLVARFLPSGKDGNEERKAFLEDLEECSPYYLNDSPNS